ncbi:MAG: aspartate ammonia-lyase [Clostridiaceae bacterium]
MSIREETDSIGTLPIPANAYYGIQSLRAQINFQITGRIINPQLIISLAKVKKAAAITNRNAGLLENQIAEAIIAACDEIISGRHHEQFIVDPIQGGAGTSANMNANEVIANLSIELLGGTKGDYKIIHPNDHVNMAQSTNDVFPTAGKLTVLVLLFKLTEQLQRLHHALEQKSHEFYDVIKVGRTQMQDAVPIRLGQSFHAFAQVVKRDISRMDKIAEEMKIINMGGTAIGTAVNASFEYVHNITKNLSDVTGYDLVQAEDLIDATQNLDAFVNASGIIKTCAVNLSKISNDLRLLSSGPRTGIGEINLPAQQNGSSIMPGKVNPVIPEVVSQVAFNIIGNDVAITMAAEAGQLELNAFEPVLFYNLFESIETLTGAIQTLVDNCIVGITANKEHCRKLLDHSVATVTALCPYIGYKRAADIAKFSLKTGVTVRELAIKEGLVSESQARVLLNPAAMTVPSKTTLSESCKKYPI